MYQSHQMNAELMQQQQYVMRQPNNQQAYSNVRFICIIVLTRPKRPLKLAESRKKWPEKILLCANIK